MRFRTLAASFTCAAMVMTLAPVAIVGASGGDDTAEALQAVEALLGSQTAVSTVTTDSNTAVHLVEDGISIDIPTDPHDGIGVEQPTGTSIVVVPTDSHLTDFERETTTAVAEGDGYSAIAQPLEDGGFRLAVVLEDASAPTSLSYQFDLDPGVTPVRRADGGYDFIDPAGIGVGAIGAPWAVDAAGMPVAAAYDFDGTVLTRTVTITDATVFPVVTNFCIFGKNPNGSCRGSGVYKEALAAVAAGWLTRAVCLTGALGAGAATAGLGAVAVASLCSAAGFAVGKWASGRV